MYLLGVSKKVRYEGLSNDNALTGCLVFFAFFGMFILSDAKTEGGVNVS